MCVCCVFFDVFVYVYVLFSVLWAQLPELNHMMMMMIADARTVTAIYCYLRWTPRTLHQTGGSVHRNGGQSAEQNIRNPHVQYEWMASVAT